MGMGIITESSLRAMLRGGIPNPFPLQPGEKLTPAAVDFLKYRGIPVLQRSERDTHSSNAHVAKTKAEFLRIPVGVSNRHVHLSQAHIEQLFGQGHRLTPDRQLSQPGQFAAVEKVCLQGAKGEIHGVRVLGPARHETQVEISRTDGFQLGTHAPLRLSGNIVDTPGLTLIGPAGKVVLENGVIVAKCHVHMSPADADHFQVKSGESMMLRTLADHGRPLIFPTVIVRVHERFVLDFHVDVDEANAAGLRTGDYVEVVHPYRFDQGDDYSER